MGLISYIILVVVVGFLVWLAVAYVPMPAEFKRALPILAIIVLVLILLIAVLGGVGGHDVPIPRLR